jgi:hypothetical protein
MSDLEGWSRVIEDDNNQDDQEVQSKLKKNNQNQSEN